MNKKKKSIKFTWPKGKQINGDIIFINGKNFAFIFLSIISAFINLVFISNLTKSGYTIGSILTIPGSILLGLMSIGLDITKLLHSIQINSLNEIYRKIKNFEWSKKFKRAKNKWLTVYIFYVILSIITSMSLSTISIGAGITRNANTLKQIDEFIIKGEQFVGVDHLIEDTNMENLVSKVKDLSEKDSTEFTKTQMANLWPQIEAYKDERAEFDNSEEFKEKGWECEWKEQNASDYWDKKNADINRLLQNAGYGSVSGVQIKNLNRFDVEQRIRTNYLATSKTTTSDEALSQLNKEKDESNEDARAWVETLNSVGLVNPKTGNVVVFDTDEEKSAIILASSALTLLKALRVDVENDSGDIGSSSKIFMQLGSKIDSAKTENITFDNLTNNTSGSLGTTEILMMSMLLFLSLLVELGINQFSTKTKITKKMLDGFSHYFPADFNINEFMIDIYIDDLNFGRITQQVFDKKIKECIDALHNSKENIIEKYKEKAEPKKDNKISELENALSSFEKDLNKED